MSEEVNCKVRIRYGKLYVSQSKNWRELERQKRHKTVLLKKPISEYKQIPKTANIYFVIEDRVFFSHSLNQLHKISPKLVKKALLEHILQGIQVTEHQIQPIDVKLESGVYTIGDFVELVNAFEEREEGETNEEKLFNDARN